MNTHLNTRPNKNGDFIYTTFENNGNCGAGRCETLEDAVAMCKYNEQFGNIAYCMVKNIKETWNLYISHIPFFTSKFEHVKPARIYEHTDGKCYVGFPME